MKVKKISFLLFAGALLAFASCKDSKSGHPIWGTWKLEMAGDSVVFNDPNGIQMLFSEDGRITTIDYPDTLKADYMVSNDTTVITILEEGKVIVSYNVHYLDYEKLILKEGYDLIQFKKIEDE